MRHGAGRLEAAQRAARVPAALELIDDASRALLLLAYRHRMPDSEIASRVGANPGLVATLREGSLERLVAVTGASSRDAVITWLEFVPEASLVPAVAGTALATLPGDRSEPRGDVWREAKLLLAAVGSFLVLYAAAEVDPGSRTAKVPAARPPQATRVAVVPGQGERPGGMGSDRASRYAGPGSSARPSAAGARAAVRAPPASPAPVRVAAAPVPSGGAPAHAPRGSRGLAGVTTTTPTPTSAPEPQPQPQPQAPPAPGPPTPEEGGAGPVVTRGGPEPAAPHPSPVHPDGPPGHRGGGPPGLRGGGPPGLRGGGPPGLRGGGPPGLRGGGPPGHRR